MVDLNILTRACPFLLHVGNGEKRRVGVVSCDDRADPCSVDVTCCLGGRCLRPEWEAPEVVLEDHRDLLPLGRRDEGGALDFVKAIKVPQSSHLGLLCAEPEWLQAG
eukprot:1239566-Rhodomonas_salina.1